MSYITTDSPATMRLITNDDNDDECQFFHQPSRSLQVAQNESIKHTQHNKQMALLREATFSFVPLVWHIYTTNALLSLSLYRIMSAARVTALRRLMGQHNVQAYIIPSTDPHLV
jgi:hypothetical protein